MIIYDLSCEKGHKFEGWFTDRSAFEEQRGQSLIVCPICGSSEAEIIPSSLTVMGRDDRMERNGNKEVSPRKALQMLGEFVEMHFEDVGDRFADVAMRIHKGEEEVKNIRGTTTKAEEDVLREEGVNFIKIPVAKYDS